MIGLVGEREGWGVCVCSYFKKVYINVNDDNFGTICRSSINFSDSKSSHQDGSAEPTKEDLQHHLRILNLQTIFVFTNNFLI